MSEKKIDMSLKLVATRKEAIAWIKSFCGEGEGEVVTWEDIVPRERIHEYLGETQTRLAVTWGVEEGAIWMLKELFDIKEDELK